MLLGHGGLLPDLQLEKLKGKFLCRYRTADQEREGCAEQPAAPSVAEQRWEGGGDPSGPDMGP